jgi:poly(A)-specific ribonuclease
MASLREWIDGSIRGAPSLLLPACNRFLRRALYESIELEYPALILENGGSEHRDQIRVWRLSEEEKQLRKERLEKEAWEKLILNIGFWRVFHALSNANKGLKETNSIVLASNVNDVEVTAEPQLEQLGRRVPIIVHNGLMDILFLLTHFCSHQLPETYQEAKALIADTFPLIYDTKILATECSEQSAIGDNTILGALYSKFVENDDAFSFEQNFEITNASATDPDQLHEASYDAFMTGAVFVALTNRILGEEKVANLVDMLSSQYNHVTRDLFGRNKVRSYLYLRVCFAVCLSFS